MYNKVLSIFQCQGHISDSNPVPVRATLARGGSSKRKVPSINKTEQPAAWHDNSVKVKGGFGDGIEHSNHEEVEEVCVEKL